MNKHFFKPNNISPPLPFYENATHFKYRISVDTKVPIAPSSQGNSYIFVKIDDISRLVVSNTAPQISSKYAIQTLLYPWITSFGPHEYLVFDRGTVNKDVTHLCSLFCYYRFPWTPYSPWTNGLVEGQNRNLDTHLRLFLLNPPNIWSFQTQMCVCAQNTTPLSQLQLSSCQSVFHTHPRIPINFSLSLTRGSSKSCIATSSKYLPPHTHFSDQDLDRSTFP